MIKKTPRLLRGFDGLLFKTHAFGITPANHFSVKRSSMRVSHLYPYPGY